MATKPVAVNTIFEIDWTTKKAKHFKGDHKFVEFCSNEDCVVVVHNKKLFGFTMIELSKDEARTVEVLDTTQTSGWHAVPMNTFVDTQAVAMRLADPQNPPVLP